MTEEKRDAASQKLGAHFKWTLSVLGVVASIVTLLAFVVPGDRMTKIASGAVITVLITCLIEFMRFCARKRGKFLKLSCPYLISAAVLAGGVWWVYRSFLDWILAALLWITSTATACFVIRERRARRQAKERGAQVAEEHRQVIDGLSDAAVELIVAALTGCGVIYRKEKGIVLNINEATYEEDTPFISDMFPKKTVSDEEVLGELAERGFLQKYSDNGYKVTTYAQTLANQLLARDFYRILNVLPNSAKILLLRVKSIDELLVYELTAKHPRVLLIDSATNDLLCASSMYSPESVFQAIRLLQKNKLIEKWQFKNSLDSQPWNIDFAFETMTHKFWDDGINLGGGGNFYFVSGRLTERGILVAKKLQELDKRVKE